MTLFNRATQLRMRRILRRRQRQVEAVSKQAEAQFDHNLIARFDRLLHVKRFVLGWLSLVVLISVCTVLQTVALTNYYQHVQAVPGGIYNEGMVGTYSNASPLFASGNVDTAVSKLIFSGLLTYDNNNTLVGDLASDYSVDQSGRQYTVHLKPHLTWQDGQTMTAQDVAFTYHLIQNPDVQSPLLSSWQGITVTAPNATTIKFVLPNPLSAFPYSLTNGIVPQHILSSIPPAELRASSFNTLKPVGTGPFAWQALQTNGNTDPAQATSLIALKPFKNYYGGRPKLDGFVIHTYPDDNQLVQAFQKRDINAIAGLQSMPKALQNDNLASYDFSSTSAKMTFFKTSSGVLADAQVRQALVQGANVPDIIQQLGYSAKPVKEPLLIGQLGYDSRYQQQSYNLATANTTLDKAGWVRGADGVRSKGAQPLTFRLYAQDTPENRMVVHQLITDWKAIGVNAIPALQQLTDFQTTLEFHTYDALLYSISIGVDPDVFAYWDSTQADLRSTNRLNFSEYKSAVADSALEAGRTRAMPTLRTIKYRPFLQAWQTDAPALGLYQPRLLYISRGPVYNLQVHTLNSETDRYNSVAKWEISTARVTD